MPERGAFPEIASHSGHIDDAALAAMRVQRFLTERVAPAVYRDTRPVEVDGWTVHGEPVPFSHAITQDFTPFPIGTAWGRPWDTVWLRVRGSVPQEWRDVPAEIELNIDLGFVSHFAGFQAEAIAYRSDGSILKAVEPLNAWVPIDPDADEFEIYLEAAANPNVAGDFSFRPTALGDPRTSGPEPIYRLRTLELGLLDRDVWELLQDAATLRQLADELPRSLPRQAEITRALDRMVDEIDPDDVHGTVAAGRAALAAVLGKPAYASAHTVHAVGHAHIDSAWLWPVRETVRKVARTFSNVLDLLDRDPEFVFAASSAQQYAWLKQHYPELYARVKRAVAAGRFVPVGGMWVESDTNMPGGEALVRQFVAGKRFFLEEFGIDSEEVWLPDSFGYSAALPQIARGAGAKWFLTQKISWNETNRMPHHSFDWEGIDGTRVFTHFPPTDTYNGDLSGAELAKAQRQYAEKGHANTSLAPFGWGDGGGGPTREMLAAAHRANNLEGSPRVKLSSPRGFFESAQAEYVNPPVWVGELYLELHRGTYTSQARTKRGNRRSEALLREAELWATTATVRSNAEYPFDALEQAWQTVLLQQFHDILPGSSIAWVHREAERNYANVAERLEEVITESLSALTGRGTSALLVNSGPYVRAGVAAGAVMGAPASRAPAAAPAPAPVSAAEPTGAAPHPAPVTRDGNRFVLRSPRTRAVFDDRGLLVSLIDVESGREVVPEGTAGNLLQLFRDTPRQWDAWDIDEEDKRTVHELTDVDSITVTPDGGSLVIVRSPGGSTITQTVTLHEETGALDLHFDIDWRERQKLLKLAFPMDIRAERATSEIQFGHIHRPTHRNTSWDVARFETVAHRWVHVGEPGFGVAIANDCVYGHDIRNGVAPGGHPMVTARLSLLRAPLYPDPESDQGRHQFSVSISPGADIPRAVAEGYRLHLPLRRITGAREVAPLVSVDSPGVVLETVKLSEDRTGDVVIRLYEAFGTRSAATLTTGFDWTEVIETDLLERPTSRGSLGSPSGADIPVTLRPFQILTLRFRRPR